MSRMKKVNRRIIMQVTVGGMGLGAILRFVGPLSAQTTSNSQRPQDTRPKTRAAFEARHASQPPHSFAGLWVTADGNIRHLLLPNGRYDEARGSRENAYRGRYVITGEFIDYLDDTGFTADGEFIENVLYHAGMVMRRLT